MTETLVPPSIDSYRHALRQLLVGWSMHTERGIEIPVERAGVLSLVYPWVAQVHRYGGAFLRLEKQGFTHESHPIVRAALEYALMSHWVSVTGDAGVASRYAEDDRLMEAMLEEARGRSTDVAPNNWNLDLLQEYVESSDPVGANEEKVVLKVQQICTAIGVGNTLYPAYRVHSWFAHPTTHSAPMYLEAQADGLFALREKPADPAPGSNLSMLTYCVYWSRRVLDDMTTGHRYSAWLDDIGASIQVMPRLPAPRG